MLQSIFEALAALFSTIGKLTPSDHIRDGRFDLKKDNITQVERIKIQNTEYARLKGHTGANIADEINLSCGKLSLEDRDLIIKNVTASITAYRMRHPVIFKKWLKANGLK